MVLQVGNETSGPLLLKTGGLHDPQYNTATAIFGGNLPNDEQFRVKLLWGYIDVYLFS